VKVSVAERSFTEWQALHGLLAEAFASMEGRIDPPSSFLGLSPEALRDKAANEILILAREGTRLIGCGYACPVSDHLYLSKLAVAEEVRRRGVLRAIVACAEGVARSRGLSSLQLLTRIELHETHAAFGALDFVRIGTQSHPGFTRPTSLRFERRVA
jgi:N-acetylglutamate synthase-like GNAT family acetyltransferase